uniref:Uncharacterized protein n=1 Tax=Opuntia streptacantha TaxID=393608 RepID=A0A7C8YDH5_OPUST
MDAPIHKNPRGKLTRKMIIRGTLSLLPGISFQGVDINKHLSTIILLLLLLIIITMAINGNYLIIITNRIIPKPISNKTFKRIQSKRRIRHLPDLSSNWVQHE